MSDTHPIACRCGAFRGAVARPAHGTRATCYCRDCQAFARFLGSPDGMMDAAGGTDIVAVRPRHVSFLQGSENLTCMSLSPHGTLRWYTRCCGTPIGNTPRDLRISHVGLVHTCLEQAGADLAASFGPVRMRVEVKSAHGSVPANSWPSFAWAMLRYMASVAWSRLGGGYRINPFFPAGNSQPLVEPLVVSETERARLRDVTP